MIIAHNGTCTMYCNLMTDIQIAKEVGYEGIELIGSKLYRYLDQGFSIAEVKEALDGFPVVAVGYIQDIERQEPGAYQSLLDECELMCSRAEQLGCSTVQILTGPIGPGLGDFEGYRGLMGRDWEDVRDLTSKNLKVLCDIAASHKVCFYLEPLTWSPVHTLEQILELFDATERDNVGMVIDFWHMWTSGIRPEQISRLDAKLIYGVHYCDSLAVPEESEVISHDLRHVWSGGGHIPLKDWVKAVCATGYDGWWSCELFSPKHWELDPHQTARLLREQLRYLLI